jgi:hypothetical protein
VPAAFIIRSIALMMEVASTSESSVNFYQTTQSNVINSALFPHVTKCPSPHAAILLLRNLNEWSKCWVEVRKFRLQSIINLIDFEKKVDGFLNVSNDGVLQSGFISFWTLPIVSYSKKHRTFRKPDLSSSSGVRKGHPPFKHKEDSYFYTTVINLRF